ncbi:MAG: hypothetical protein H6839_12010 [Planctomycetes bacterium]|nr:hypothetical protein [Planctomycetota bacterium]
MPDENEMPADAAGEPKRKTRLGVQQPINGENGNMTDLRAPVRGYTPGAGHIGDGGIRLMLGDACRLLWQIARITSGVLDTVRLGDIRKLCAEEMPPAVATIREDGTYAPDHNSADAVEERAKAALSTSSGQAHSTGSGQDPSTSSGQDHRKRPRGRSHPLLMLIRLGVQATRLLKQIATAAYPHAMNTLNLDEQKERFAERESLAWHRMATSGADLT